MCKLSPRSQPMTIVNMPCWKSKTAVVLETVASMAILANTKRHLECF